MWEKWGTKEMIRHGLTGPPASSDPSDAVLSGIYPLYFRDEFLGSCIAIAPRILITAGHHFNSLKDDVGDLHLLDGASEGEITVAYVSKDRVHDLLVLWVSADLNWVPLRGFQPPVGARVATVWLSTKWPHDTIVSPGTVIEVNRGNCVVRGTVSTTGSSGSPVVDQFGDHIVGMHLISNTRDGSRVSGFISSRMIVSALVAMGVSCREVER